MKKKRLFVWLDRKGWFGPRCHYCGGRSDLEMCKPCWRRS